MTTCSLTRLAPICVVQFKKDPRKDQKLKECEAESASRVADKCAKLLMLKLA